MVTTATSSHVEHNINSNLHAVPGKMIAVLKVSGIKWSDLGAPKRVLACMQMAGILPRLMENYGRRSAAKKG